MKKSQPQPDRRTLRVRFEVKSLDALTGEFTGYAAVWDKIDLLGDVCLAGAFADTLASWQGRGTWPRVFWAHWQPIGHTLALAEDEHGLLVSGRLWMNVPAVAALVADEIAPAMPNVGMSFEFIAVDYEVRDDVRYIARLDLLDDVTLSLNPVNRQALLVELKDRSSGGSLPPSPNPRVVEAVLCDAGFSRTAARSIVAHGVPSLCEAEAKSVEAGLTAVHESLVNLLNTLTNANRRI